jgi:putative MATE family efflux protein
MHLFAGSRKDGHSMLFSGEELRRLMLPLLLEQLLIVVMSIVNSMMVSSVGEDAVSAISLVDSINILLTNVFAALATGGAVVTAQYLGRKELHMAGKAAKQLMYAMLAVSLLISGLSIMFYQNVLAAVFPDVDTAVMDYSRKYFLLILFSFPFLSVCSGGSALLRAVGNSKASLSTTLLINLFNVIGNAILIYIFHLGVEGAAIAAIFARAVGSAIMLRLLKNPNHQLLHIPSLWKFEWDGNMVKRILGIGIPNGLENSLFQLGKILLQSLVSSLGGVAIAANAVASNLSGFQTIPGSAVGLALITVVGRCAGAGEYGQAKQYVKKLMGFAYITMALLVGVILIACPYVINSYGLSPETAGSVRQLIMVYTIVCVFFWPSSFALPNALRAAGDVRFTMVVSGLSMLIFRIGFSYLLVQGFGMGVMGVWVAMMIDWIARSAAFYIRYRSGRWKQNKVL